MLKVLCHHSFSEHPFLNFSIVGAGYQVVRIPCKLKGSEIKRVVESVPEGTTCKHLLRTGLRISWIHSHYPPPNIYCPIRTFPSTHHNRAAPQKATHHGPKGWQQALQCITCSVLNILKFVSNRWLTFTKKKRKKRDCNMTAVCIPLPVREVCLPRRQHWFCFHIVIVHFQVAQTELD